MNNTEVILTNRWVIGPLIAFLFLLLGAFAKKLIGKGGWKIEYFFCGIDATISTLASSLINIYITAKQITIGKNIFNEIGPSATYLLLCFFLLMMLMTIHQDLENNSSSKQRTWLLLGFSNIIGISLLMGFIIFIKHNEL